MNAYKYLVLLLLLISSPAYATGDPTAFIYMIISGGVALLWPLVIPLFFLRNADRKIITYIALIFITYGAISVVHIPLSALTQLIDLKTDVSMGLYILILSQILAIVLSIFILKKFSVPIAVYFNKGSDT